jgi:hypothetical protein
MRAYPERLLRKKACPKKGWPLLTYEKHQIQISYIEYSEINLIGKQAKDRGLLSKQGPPLLHSLLPAFNQCFLYNACKFFFGAEK